MNIQKRQSIQKIVIDQTGQQRLILNDYILGSEGAQTIAQLIPEYHSNIKHLEIKGNNIDADGFQSICAALMHCTHLKSIEAEWNCVGSSPAGLEALCHLVKNLKFLEFIDLKNNRINHNLVETICTIIHINNRSLKVIDLRWNQLGQIGAQAIYTALAHNSALKYIGLQDNRISLNSLNQIQSMLKNVTRGTKQVLRQVNPQQSIYVQTSKPSFFPISDDAYPSMDLQVMNGQLRAKIQNEQNQAEIYHNKLKIQIDKVLQKMKLKGTQSHQLSLKLDSLSSQNLSLINHLRETQRLLCHQKQRYLGHDKSLNVQKSTLKTDKYNLSLKIQSMTQRCLQKQQRQLQDLQGLMNQKSQKLSTIYRDKIAKKRNNRQKLTQLKEDIIKLKVNKENAWDKLTDMLSNTGKASMEQRLRDLEELVANADFNLKSQIKRSQNLSQQLSSTVLKGLEKQQKMQNQIFNSQNQIKEIHSQMGTTNVQIQENQSKCALLQSELIDQQCQIQMRRKYIKHIHSQSAVNVQIQRLKQQQDLQGERLVAQTLQMRIADLEKAIRIQLSQNKMIRNQYDKLLSQIQNVSKKTIQSVLFQV